MGDFSHIDDKGNAKMVDISDKEKTQRKASAKGIIKMDRETLNRIKENNIKKGPVLETARIAAIMAVKNTADTIPMCHPISIGGIDVEFSYQDNSTIEI